MCTTKRVHISDDYDVLIDRTTKWGNPYSSKPSKLAKFETNNRKESIAKYKKWITEGKGKYLLKHLNELKGKKIACWCKPNQSCHGDVLIELINNYNKRLPI